MAKQCKAALKVDNQRFWCELDAPHPGLAHTNTDAGAAWCSAGESQRYGKDNG